MKINKRVAISIFIIGVMLASSLAYGIQFSYQSLLQSKNSEQSLPAEKILNYELNTQQTDLAYRQGYTIIKFSSSAKCIECLSVKNFLESVASKYNPQIYVEELSRDQDPSLIISSFRGQLEVENITADNILDSLCGLMAQPPIDCALRNV